ncbi:MAG: translation initiation factor IF-2 [Gemmatimonadota bacterium]|nr:translation initiation factor IF-2 [Gemmatimonadota bacterium]MDE2871775.1 translation initiation factor IF-2 [Gemmatimonadota bacterium]
MRVKELAVDLRVNADVLLRFLRESGVRVGHADAFIRDADVAKVRTRLERERRAGRGEAADVMRAVVRAHKPTSRRRRRRRRVSPPAPRPEASAETPVLEDVVVRQDGDGEAVAAPRVEAAAVDAEQTPPDGRAEEPVISPAAEAPAPAAVSAGPVVEEVPPTSVAPPPDHTDAMSEAPAETASAEPAGAEPAEAETPVSAAVDPAPATPAEPGVEETPSAPPLAPARPGTKPAPARDGAPGGLAPVRSRPEPAASAGPGGKVRIQAEGYTSDGRRKKERKRGRRRRGGDRDKAKENIQRVMAEIKGGRKKRRKGKATVAAAKEERVAAEERAAEKVAAEARTVRVNEFLTVAELAELIETSAAEIIGSAFRNMGLPVTINQRLDFDQIELLLEGFGFKAVREADYLPPTEEIEEDDPADLRPRPPVVTVMGHVDHGKTRLLDWIRRTNVVAGEAGGITQHIGAYHVELDEGRTISFLDTPGHAAFTAMRARGADVTDLVVLVVAADDAVMPQTVEAISHSRNAGVPMVVAVNKIDLPTAEPDRVRQDLLQHGVTVEDFGGETLVADISARTGDGMDDLLEKILLQAEILEIQANPARDAVGTVVEAELDIGKGPVATILVQNGTLRVGDSFVAGLYDGRVRALLDERGNHVDEIGPGIPGQILGAAGVPQAGDVFQVMDGVAAASIAANRQRLDREKQLRIKERGIKLGDFTQLLAAGDVSTLRLVVKGDVDGSVQALCDSLEQLSAREVQVEIIHRGVGAVNESDVMLALTAGAVIIGFRVRPDAGARQASARETVEIQTYDVIYEAVDDVRAGLEGLLAPERRESIVGAAEARVIFKIRGVGTIAGSYVVEGAIQRGALARVIREGVVIYDGEIGSLKRFKDDAREVKEGFECGIGIANFNDLKAGDIVETYQIQEVARTLASVERD